MQGSGGDEDILLDDYDSDEDSNERDEVEYFSCESFWKIYVNYMWNLTEWTKNRYLAKDFLQGEKSAVHQPG